MLNVKPLSSFPSSTPKSLTSSGDLSFESEPEGSSLRVEDSGTRLEERRRESRRDKYSLIGHWLKNRREK